MNEYLGIEQITTGGYNARGNATVERFMQHLTANLTKCSKAEYDDIGLYLQAIAFAHNTSFSSSLNCTPFEAGHGLKARGISDARLSPRMQLNVELRGNEEDCVTHWDTTVPLKVIELASRFAKDAVKHSEWHRKMTADKLNQSGKPIDEKLLHDGMEVCFYKPPSQHEVIKKGRKAKHLHHYHGPAIIKQKIRSRTYELSYNGKTFKRDAGMIIPVRHLPDKDREFDPAEVPPPPTVAHSAGIPCREGELIICMDDSTHQDWYVAEITKVLDRHIQVNYFHTPSPPLENYSTQSLLKVTERLSQAHFRRTWFMHGGINHGKALMTPPYPGNPSLRVWEGPLDVADLDQNLLIRNVGITSAGRLDGPTLALAAKLSIPHNYTPVADNNSEVPQELTPQLYFQYIQRVVCDCSQCATRLGMSHAHPAGLSSSNRGTLPVAPLDNEKSAKHTSS